MELDEILETSIFLKYWNVVLTIVLIGILSKWLWNRKGHKQIEREDEDNEILGKFFFLNIENNYFIVILYLQPIPVLMLKKLTMPLLWKKKNILHIKGPWKLYLAVLNNSIK